MVTVRIFKLQHLIRFMRAFHLLTTIGEERGNIEFYKSGLDFVVISRHLFVLLHIRHPFLHHYQPPNSSNYFTIHLKEFRQHLGHRALTSSSMDFNLDHHYPPLAALTFHDDNSGNYFFFIFFFFSLINCYINFLDENEKFLHVISWSSCSVTVSLI